MSKIKLLLFSLFALGILFGCNQNHSATTVDLQELKDYYNPPAFDPGSAGADSTALEINNIAGPDIVPSPSCLAVLPTGEVFVGVDMIGSLNLF